MKQISDLPGSDSEFWDGEVSVGRPSPLSPICTHHNKRDWLSGEYIDNRDGTITCRSCPWGTNLPGGYRVEKGKVLN